jgi:hypothetical protein
VREVCSISFMWVMFRVLGHKAAYTKYACDAPSGLYRKALCLRHPTLNSTQHYIPWNTKMCDNLLLCLSTN